MSDPKKTTKQTPKETAKETPKDDVPTDENVVTFDSDEAQESMESGDFSTLPEGTKIEGPYGKQEDVGVTGFSVEVHEEKGE